MQKKYAEMFHSENIGWTFMDEEIRSEVREALYKLSQEPNLFYELIQYVPYPIQVFAPNGLLLQVNHAFIRVFRIADTNAIVGKYNILQDPTLAEYGALYNVENAFSGKAMFAHDFKVPIHVIKKILQLPIDEIEAIYMDVSTLPFTDSAGKLLCVVNMMIPKMVSTGRIEASQAKQFIESHWLDEFNIRTVANAVHLSPAHFSRLFKANTGLTPREYYIQYKLHRLQERLIDANLSVAQAFEACGLHYHSHYAKLFKKQTGYSPSEYHRNTKS
jgi:AraC-like DNA-binding protein